MNETPTDAPSASSPAGAGAGPRGVTRDAALAIVARLLLALAGACALSGAIGMAALLLGYGAPHLLALLAPPVVVLLAAPVAFLRAQRTEER